MGGIVGLTIRWADGTEYRGSCWTNVLPEGLMAAPFFLSPEASEKHVRAWLKRILRERERVPDIKELWDHGPYLAPVEYGLVLVDYRRGLVLSRQAYCNIAKHCYYEVGTDPFHKDKVRKHKALARAGLTIEGEFLDWGKPIGRRKLRGHQQYSIRSFWTVDESLCEPTAKTRAAIRRLGFSLNRREQQLWRDYIKERAE